MKKVTVLGGSGFIGSHLSDYLSEMNYRVTIFDLKKSPWLKKGQKMIIGDTLNVKKLSSAIKGSDYVFNFAALADMDSLKYRAIDTVRFNILGTVNALEVSRKYKVKKLIIFLFLRNNLINFEKLINSETSLGYLSSSL